MELKKIIPAFKFFKEERLIFGKIEVVGGTPTGASTLTLQDLLSATKIKDGEINWALLKKVSPDRAKAILTQKADDPRSTEARRHVLTPEELKRLQAEDQKLFDILKEKEVEHERILQETRESTEEAFMEEHTVQPGENMTRIASRYGLTAKDLFTYNTAHNPSFGTSRNINLIYSGEKLLVPKPGHHVESIKREAETSAMARAEVYSSEGESEAAGAPLELLDRAVYRSSADRIKDLYELAGVSDQFETFDSDIVRERADRAWDSLLGNTREAFEEYGQAMDKTQRYQELARQVLLDKSNISEGPFGILVSSDEGALGWFVDNNAEEQTERMLNEQIPATTDKEGWRNFMQELGETSWDSLVASGIATGISYTVSAAQEGRWDPTFAVIGLLKLGEINLGIQSGHGEFMSEEDLMFPAEFIRLSNILKESNPSSPEYRDADAKLKKLLAYQERSAYEKLDQFITRRLSNIDSESNVNYAAENVDTDVELIRFLPYLNLSGGTPRQKQYQDLLETYYKALKSHKDSEIRGPREALKRFLEGQLSLTKQKLEDTKSVETPDFKLIAEHIALSNEAQSRIPDAERTLLADDIAQRIADGTIDATEKAYYEKRMAALRSDITQYRQTVATARDIVDEREESMQESVGDILGGITFERYAIPGLGWRVIPFVNVREVGYFLRMIGGMREEELESALTRYVERTTKAYEKEKGKARKNEEKLRDKDEIRSFPHKDPSMANLLFVLRKIYGDDAQQHLKQAYEDYKKGSLNPNDYDERYRSLISIAAQHLFPTLKENFRDPSHSDPIRRDPTLETIQIFENTYRAKMGTLWNDAIQQFVDKCIEARAWDKTGEHGQQVLAEYESAQAFKAEWLKLREKLQRLGPLKDCIVRMEILETFIGKLIEGKLQGGYDELKEVADSIQWVENLSDRYDEMDVRAMEQNAEIHPDFIEHVQAIQTQRAILSKIQTEYSGKLLAALAHGEDPTAVITAFKKAAEDPKQIIQDHLEALKSKQELPASDRVEAHDTQGYQSSESRVSGLATLIQMLRETDAEPDFIDQYQKAKEIAEKAVEINTIIRENALNEGIPVSLDTFLRTYQDDTPEERKGHYTTALDKANDFQSILVQLTTTNPRVLKDWTIFHDTVKSKLGIDLVEHTKSATTSLYGMAEGGPDGKVNGHYASNVNMLMLLLPERTHEGDPSRIKPPIVDIMREAGKHFGLNLTNTEIMDAVAHGEEKTAEGKHLNTGHQYFPPPGSPNFDFIPQGYTFQIRRLFNLREGQLQLTYDFMLRGKCFNVNIPQENAIKAILKKAPPELFKKDHFDPEVFATNIPKLFSLYIGWYEMVNQKTPPRESIQDQLPEWEPGEPVGPFSPPRKLPKWEIPDGIVIPWDPRKPGEETNPT